MKKSVTLVQLLIATCTFIGIALGQESRATITGTVTDAKGGVLVGARVAVKNLETNVVTTVQTNNAGSYNVPPINPGQYSVTVSAAGFKATVRNNVELRVADRKELDVELEVGGTTETVVVTAEAPLLETANGSLSTTINRELVASVPTYAQDVFQLVRYAAGVAGGNTQRPFDGGDNGAVILGGTNNEVLLNGSPNTYRESSGAANTISPPPDAVGEMKIMTNVYDAEYGRTGGGVISISLKSGSNDYHGAVGWLVRNPVFNANTFTANATGAPNASFKMNEGIFELDGPFRIPKLYDGRNKTFFTYAVDVYRDSRPVGNTMVVPTALQKAGDFSQTYVSGTSGATISIYDPLTTIQNGTTYTRTPFPNATIPQGRINPIAAKVAGFFLAPNQIAPRGQPNLGIYPSYDHEPFNSHTSRWDHRLNDKETILVTVSRDLRGQTFGGSAGLPAYQARGIDYASNSFTHWRGNIQAGLNVTSVISPTLVNTARASFNRHEFGIFYYSRFYDPTQLGFPAALAAQVQALSFPQFSVAGYDAIGGAANTLNYSSNITAGETLTKILGKHSLKFGGEVRELNNNQSSPPNSFSLSTSTSFTQSNPLQADSRSGDGMASFLLGYPSSVSSSYNSFPAQGQRYYSAFVQDDWKATRKLTLNLGLRWEYESPITDRYNRFVRGFDGTTVTTVGSVPFQGGLLFADSNNRLPYKRDLNNWAPRVGFAYQVTQKLVLRGGWAISYAPTATVASTTGFSITTSPSTSESNAGIIPITTADCTNASCGMLTNPFPTGINLPLGRSGGLLTNAGNSISFISPTRTVPYSHSFSVSAQYQLPFRTVLEVSYDGRRSRGLATSYNRDSVTFAQYLANGANLTGTTVANPYSGLLPGTSLNGATRTLQQSLLPYPQFTGVTEQEMPLGTSRYDAVLFNLEKRFSSGLSFVFNGTFVNSTTHLTYLNNGLDAPGQFITRDAGQQPYTLNLSGVYTLPFFKNGSRLTKMVLGGWQISGYSQWLSGSILGVSGANSTGLDPALPKNVRTFQRWFNTCTINNNNGLRQNCASPTEPVAWIIQKPFTLITQPDPQWRDFRGRAIPEISVSLFKIVRINERAKFELRADANNATNTPTFGNPNTTATSSLFGVTTLAQGFNYSSQGPRQLQLGAKLTF